MDVRLPKIGDSADNGTVVSILVKPGDTIAVGQTVIELEQEKAVAPIPSSAAGKVLEVKVKEGDKISVGSLLLSLESTSPSEAAGTVAPAPVKAGPARPPRIAPPPAQDSPDEDEDWEPATQEGDDSVVAASPYVRKVARDLGLKLGHIRGTGSGGRVLVEDIGRHIAKLERGVARAGRYAEEPKGLIFPLVQQDFGLYGPVTSEPLSALRKVIAQRMVENKVSLPHVTQFDEADLTQIEALRRKFKPAYEAIGVKLSPTPFIIKALVSILRGHPRFNASLNEVTETLVYKHYFHIGIAVDTEAGLVVPVIRDADKKSLAELARELGQLAEKARDRKLTAEDMRGGSFTVSNQGAIGGGHFTPVINKPETAILGIGKTALKPVVIHDGTIQARPMLPLAISYDHRVIDGGGAARFTVDFVKALEEFPESEAAL